MKRVLKWIARMMCVVCLGGAVTTAAAVDVDGGERTAEGFFCHRIESALQSGPTTIRVLPPDQPKPGQRFSVLYVLPFFGRQCKREML
jgi:hypothetical protein